MQRWTSVVLGLLAAAALIVGVVMAGRGTARVGAESAGSASAAVPDEPPPAAPSASDDGAEETPPALEPGPEATADGGTPLPASAPTAVHFGVVLFTYQGVQFAPKNARTKAEALTLAQGIIAEAKKDFAEAVKKGDRGSTADAGRIPRGVLEPEVEYALFTLDKGAVHSEPLDTPRGFWVVRRNE